MSHVDGTGKKPVSDEYHYDEVTEQDVADEYAQMDLDEEIAFDSDYESGEAGHTTQTYGGGYSSQTKNMGTSSGGIAQNGSFAGPGDGSAEQINNQVSTWTQQGKSKEWIANQLMSQYGLSHGDAMYYAGGGGMGSVSNSFGYPSTKYMQFGDGNYTSFSNDQAKMMKFMEDSAMLNESKNMQRNAKKMAHEQKIKIHMIMLQILMGDIVGALRSYAVLMDRDMRNFTRLIVSKLGKVRDARSTVIRNFARTKAPPTYAGQNSGQAARAQDRSAKYTQFVQLSTQLMNELQNTERELVDALQSMHRNMQTFWESYAGFRDQEFRTNERLMTVR